MKKIFCCLLSVTIIFAILTGCSNYRSVAEISSEPTETTAEPPTQQVTEKEEPVVLDIIPLEFIFLSGAGAWSTQLTLHSDGSFDGIYHDSDMGISGEGYPHGSVFICNFSGQFDDIKQINDYSYSMTLKEITTQNQIGEEWIEDDIRYIASSPYGLEQGKEFILYTPETPIDELSEEFLSWWSNRYLLHDKEPLITLSCYGLYNQEMGYGFFTS